MLPLRAYQAAAHGRQANRVAALTHYQPKEASASGQVPGATQIAWVTPGRVIQGTT